MKNKYILSIMLAIFCLSPLVAFSEPASKESIRKMMIKTGAGNMGLQVMNQMIPSMKKMIPDAPEKFWRDVMAEVDANQLIELVIPVYQKYLTEKDIRAMNRFYDSPAGRKLIRTQPAIMQESMQLGGQWGQQLARKILNKYKEQSKK